MKRLVLTLAALMIISACAFGAPVITFNSTTTGGHSGTIVYNPTLSSGAVGTGIDIDTINGLGTIANSGTTLKCFACVLNFTTGAVISDVSANGSNWSFAGGGSFQIFGRADLNNDGIDNDYGSTVMLLNGVFNAPVTVSLDPNQATNGLDFRFVAATLINTMDNQLEGFYGNNPQSYYGGLYNQLTGANRQNYLTDAQGKHWRFATGLAVNNNGMKDGFVKDTLVPEPATVSLWLISSLVLGFVVYRRKQQRAEA